jgi:uncharacterized protein YecE (DUF72 family)
MERPGSVCGAGKPSRRVCGEERRRLPCIPRATTDLVYVRMHGPDLDAKYSGSYSTDELRRWAGRISEWDGEGRDVWVYFNNDLHGHAVLNATFLRGVLG